MDIHNIGRGSSSPEPSSIGKRIIEAVKSGGRKFARGVGSIPRAIEKRITEVFSQRNTNRVPTPTLNFSASKSVSSVPIPITEPPASISWQEADNLRNTLDDTLFTTPQLLFKLHTIITDAESTTSKESSNLNAKEITRLLLDNKDCFHNLVLFTEKHGDITNVFMHDGDHSGFLSALKNLDKYANNEDGWNSVPFH